MKTHLITIALLAAAVAVGSTVRAAEEQKTADQAEVKKQTTCPVMGGKINKKEYVDVNGYRIYVCCAGCKEKIKSDPDKYIKKLKDEGVTPEPTPKNDESDEAS